MQAGYDYLKVVLNTTQNGPEIETLKLIVAEGKKHNKPTIVHAVSVRDTLAAIEAKPDLLVHTPHIGNLGDDPAAVKKIVDARIPMTSTLVGVRAALRRERHRAVQGQAAVPVEHALERGPGPGECAAALGGRPRELRLRHRHAMAAERDARRRAPRSQARVLAAGRRQDHHEERRGSRRCTAPRSVRSSPASWPTS